MIATRKPLEMLTAEDVMSRDVLMIPEQMDLRTAARLLSQARVSGAPVIDRDGVLIGVISTSDFVRWAEGKPAARFRTCEIPCVCSDWEVIEVERLPIDCVAGYMTPDSVTASTEATIRELARKMIDAHIHRVIVVDERDHPVGVVSSTDILAAVAHQ